MNHKLLLAKSICLLYRESQLEDRADSSADLIRTVLEEVKVSEIGIGLSSDRESILALKTTILEMCGQPQDHVYDKTDLLQRIRINVNGDDKYYDAIRQGIDDEMVEGAIKRSILNMRKQINNHFREQQIEITLARASSEFKFGRDKIKDVNTFLAEIISQLEPLSMVTSLKDPAVMGDIDLGDDSSLKKMFTEVKNRTTGTAIFRTGWKALNRMTQGGLRPGETVTIGALQHKYKTGFTLSLFAQLALFNKPLTKDPEKKPLLLRISFEDALTENLQFLYQYLKYNETKQYVDIREVDEGEMAVYVREKLQQNGFHIKMLQVDPNGWSYKSICNKIIELEAQGYSVEVLMVDYLSKVPTTGCEQGGPSGNDVMDQLSRVKIFCAGKNILFVSPHQLSTEAKALIRSGMPESEFAKHVAEKGYWEKTKGLDRIFDLGLIIHLFKHNKETFFAVARDKHRISTIVDDIDKFFMLRFPKGMPIPSDEDTDEDISFRRITQGVSNADPAIFSF